MLTDSAIPTTVGSGDTGVALGRGVLVGVEMKQRFTWRGGIKITDARIVRAIVTFVLMVFVVGSLAACGSSEKAEAPSAPKDPGKITEAEVRKVLASLDTTWSPASTGAVDVSAFAASILKQLPPELTSAELKSEADKTARIESAVAAYKRIEAAKGPKVAFRMLDNIQFVGARPASAPVRKWTADEVAMAPLLNGLAASTLMFSHGDTPMWAWQIQDVNLTGATSAKVSYDASPSLSFVLGKPNPLTFKDPTALYLSLIHISEPTRPY
jgi:hypothetical protein